VLYGLNERASDGYLAALAIEHGCELITTDGDFVRFAGPRRRHPLAALQTLSKEPFDQIGTIQTTSASATRREL
jgi:hypothetical protein